MTSSSNGWPASGVGHPGSLGLGELAERVEARLGELSRLQRELEVDARDLLRTVERTRQASVHDAAALRLLSMTELADLSGVSRATLYRLADTGDLPARKVGGSWRISVADYRAWVASEAGR